MNKLWRAILFKIGFLFALSFYGTLLYASNTEGIQTYQKNVHTSLERKQKLAEDINRYHNADNIWDVLREEFSLPHYEDNPAVQDQIDFLMQDPGFLIRASTRAAPYLYYILQQTRKRHLPAELVLLPMIESAYNPFAYSSAGAAGLWQMMPGTASGYGIKRNSWYDGRRDIVASTKAALNYLVYLQNYFEGNWLLAIAAYDSGEGSVSSAIKRNSYYGEQVDFWSLPLPQETQTYVPRLLALAIIIAHPEHYHVHFPVVQNAPYLAEVDIGGQIDLNHAADLAGMRVKDLKNLNSGFHQLITSTNGSYKIILPIENVAEFTENLENSPFYQKVHWTHYKIKSGDDLKTIAKKFNTSPESLQKMNPVVTAHLKPGKNLVIPHDDHDYASTSTSSEEKGFTLVQKNPESSLVSVQGHYTLQPGDTLYMVREDDNLKKIANRFKMSTSTLLAVNAINQKTKLDAGQKLIIPTHLTQKMQSTGLSPGDTIYMARKGDTLEKIAKKFHLAPAQIRVINLMATNDLHEGDRLIIPTRV